MSFSSLLHLLLHLLILSPSSLSSPPRREETLNYQQISHKPVDKPQSIGGIIPSSSERPRKQNNEREILQNIKMSELLQGVFLTGVLNLKLSVRKLSWPYTQCFLLHIAAEPFNGSADIAAAASTAAVTAFLEHIITEAVYGQESFRTLQCTIKRSLYQKDHHIMSISAANGKNQLLQIIIFHIISKGNYFHTLRLSLTQLHWNFARCQVLAVYESFA